MNIAIAAYKSSSLSKIIDKCSQLVVVHGRKWKVRTLMTVKAAFAATTEKIAG
jgi:hypothetical protein